MHARVAIHVAILDAATDHVAVDVHVPVARIHIDVRDVNVWRRAPAPASGVPVGGAVPAVVVNRSRAPVAVVTQPAANRKADAERPEGAVVAQAEDRAGIDRIRVIHGHIDDAILRWRDDIVVVIARNVLLRRGAQVALTVGHCTHALHGRHHIARLTGVRATKRRGPVGLVGHHVERRRVVGNRLHAHIPRLVVNI